MSDLNISSVIQRERRARGITQEELARHLGVTGAAVSKWEQGSSLPDTALLPAIASFFQISVDELLDYRPELSDSEVGELCAKLREQFRDDPEAAFENLRDAARRHFSCWKLLLELAKLLVSQRSQELLHVANERDDAPRAPARTGERSPAPGMRPQVGRRDDAPGMPSQARMQAYADDALALYRRIEEDCADERLAERARIEHANLLLLLGQVDEAVHTLEELAPDAPDRATPILAIAYQLQGEPDKARRLLQRVVFRNACATVSALVLQFSLAESPEQAEGLIDAACTIDDALGTTRFSFSQAIGLYMGAAQHLMAHGNHERALDMLERFAERVEGTADIVRHRKAPDFAPLYASIGDVILTEAAREDKSLQEDALASLRLSSEQGLLADPMWDGVRETRRFRLAASRLRSALA